MTVEVRRLREGEAERLRELRMRALRDAPGAFATRFEEASARPPDYWDEWNREGAAAEQQVTILAIDGERWVGMVSGWLLEDRAGCAWLARLWVDPTVRGAGIGSRLIEAVADWARTAGANRLELSVTANNAAASALYARAGFAETGRRRPLPADPTRTEVFLVRPL